MLVAAACGGKASPPSDPRVRERPVGDLGVQPGNLERVTAYVEAIGAGWGDAAAFNGYVMVAQHDQILYARGFGYADRAAKRGAGPDTSFRIGSITKSFTAALILRLEQDGALKVTDTVGALLPDFRGPARDVTVHQLLSHTGGVPSYTADPAVMGRRDRAMTVAELLASFADKPLEFPPGSRWAYSNSGYALLGAIIERVTGRSYADAVRDLLLVPAGMTRTVVGDAEGDRDRAIGYQADGDALVPAAPIDMSIPFAAGAIRSTASDLVRWHRALEGDAILGAAARAKLSTPVRERYGYGWMVDQVAGHDVVWHNGGIDGFNANLWRAPGADLVVVVLGNALELDTTPIAKAVMAAAFGEAIEPAPARARGAMDPAVVARVIGTYALSAASKQDLTTRGAPAALLASIETIAIHGLPDALEVKPVGQGPARLAPTGPATFYDPGTRAELRFDLPATGPATGFTLTQGPLTLTYTRAP